MRKIVLGGGLRGRKRNAGRERALDREHAGLRKAIDFGSADIGLRLGVREHRLDLGAALRLDAAGRIDLFQREQRALAALFAFVGQPARHRMQDADLQACGLRTQDRRHAESSRGDAGRANDEISPRQT